MKVLDATFLIDYLDGVEATRQFYEDNGGDQLRWTVPVPALAAVLVGAGNLPNGDVDGARADLLWSTFTPSSSRGICISWCFGSATSFSQVISD